MRWKENLSTQLQNCMGATSPTNIVTTYTELPLLTNAEKRASFGDAMFESGIQVTVPAWPCFVNSPNSTTVFDMHVDDAKPGLPFFVFCPVVPMLLDGCALLQLAMVCLAARDCTRNLSKVLQATRREIRQVTKYLDLAPLRFPGFGCMDVMHLYRVSFQDNRAWHSGENHHLRIWIPTQQVYRGMTPLKAFRCMNQHLQGSIVFEWVLDLLASSDAQFLFPTAEHRFESTNNPWCCGVPAIVIAMRCKTVPVTITLHYTAPVYMKQRHWPRKRSLTA